MSCPDHPTDRCLDWNLPDGTWLLWNPAFPDDLLHFERDRLTCYVLRDASPCEAAAKATSLGATDSPLDGTDRYDIFGCDDAA